MLKLMTLFILGAFLAIKGLSNVIHDLSNILFKLPTPTLNSDILMIIVGCVLLLICACLVN